MDPTIALDTRQFDMALTELASISRASDSDIVRGTSKFVLKNLLRLTPEMSERSRSIREIKRRAQKSEFWRRRLEFLRKQRSRARAGWFEAWRALGIPGTPRVRNKQIRNRREGEFVDRIRAVGSPSFSMINEVPYIEKLNQRRNILQKALDFQAKQMERSIDRIYTAILRKKSG